MKSKIVQLEQTRAIPIPQQLLDACGLKNEVDIEAQGGVLVIRGLKPPREGWEDAFQKMAQHGHDKPLLASGCANKWDEEEWEW